MPAWLWPVVAGVGQVVGGVLSDRSNKRNTRAQQNQFNSLSGRVDRMMGPSQSLYADQLMQFMQNMPKPGTQGTNAGQDALMQMLRRNYDAPDMAGATQQFDNTDLFRALGAQDAVRQEEQVAGLLGSAGSLGQRFGTALRQQEMDLRRNLANDASVRNAGIASGSFESAQQRLLQALGMGLQNRQQFDGTQLQAALGLDSSMRGQQDNYNQLMMSGFGQAGALQGQQQQYNAGLLGLLAGMPVPQQQPSPWGQMLGNIGSIGQNYDLMQTLLAQMNRRPAGGNQG